jgi:hypothetical protein
MVRHSMTMAPMDEVMASLSENVAELDGSGVVDMFFTDYSGDDLELQEEWGRRPCEKRDGKESRGCEI